MNAARWEQIQALFHAVADLPDPAQRASLEAQCAEDPALMTEVLTLLGEDARGDSLLDRDAAHVAAEVVEHAHRHLIVHRDLKPSNILVKPDGSVKLLDFGIAKQLDSLEGPVDRTRTGLRLMTPAYAAPEQILGDPVGIHTDIYTLGV